MKPIAFINNSLETFTPTHSGAIATFIWECCQAAARNGESPWVVGRNCEHQPYAWPNLALVEYPPLPKTKLGTFIFRGERKLDGWRHMRQRKFAANVARAIRAKGLVEATLILHNDPEMAVYLGKRFPQARIVHHFHNQQECKKHYRAAFGKCSAIVTAVSNFTARWNETYYGLGANSIKTIYNGVDSKRFAPSGNGRNGKAIINFCGRTSIEKAPDLILKAAKQLSPGGGFELQIIGSNHWGWFEMDDYQRQLQTLVSDVEGSGITVRRPGHVGREAMPGELQRAQIHVVPSRWDEPCALTILEGMASGLATVASRTGGTPELVGDAGLLFDRDSVDQLAGHLKGLINDDQSRIAYAKKARERAETFTWDKTWSHFRDLAIA